MHRKVAFRAPAVPPLPLLNVHTIHDSTLPLCHRCHGNYADYPVYWRLFQAKYLAHLAQFGSNVIVTISAPGVIALCPPSRPRITFTPMICFVALVVLCFLALCLGTPNSGLLHYVFFPQVCDAACHVGPSVRP
ncbi:hypothetical protein EV356DRAFT_197965 [Viridothelium virens]|uniref:Uncharacterized protein n=1 Tax=Viridothelium virens TaxID=1048519 RepID=A0A6A6H6E4_VIRVR|nr:hypothetical protein EV356DRAFT_197965 [Viridothelium virens]